MKKAISTKYQSARQFLFTFVAMLLLALLITLFIFDSSEGNFQIFMISYGWSLAICVTQWLGNSYIYGLLDRKYSWQDHLLKRAIFGSLALIGYSALAYLVVQMIMMLVVHGALPENPVYWILRTSYIAILISFTVSLIFVAVASFEMRKRFFFSFASFSTRLPSTE